MDEGSWGWDFLLLLRSSDRRSSVAAAVAEFEPTKLVETAGLPGRWVVLDFGWDRRRFRTRFGRGSDPSGKTAFAVAAGRSGLGSVVAEEEVEVEFDLELDDGFGIERGTEEMEERDEVVSKRECSTPVVANRSIQFKLTFEQLFNISFGGCSRFLSKRSMT